MDSTRVQIADNRIAKQVQRQDLYAIVAVITRQDR